MSKNDPPISIYKFYPRKIFNAFDIIALKEKYILRKLYRKRERS